MPATIEALPAVAEAVQERMTILLDGGVRRGTDVVKVLALGAWAVLIGRPYLWGLAVDGAHGVRRVIENLAGRARGRHGLVRRAEPRSAQSRDRMARALSVARAPAPCSQEE